MSVTRTHKKFYFIFTPYNPRGMLSLALIGIIFLSAVLYVGALYFTFMRGFGIQEDSKKRAELANAVLLREIELQKNKTNIAEQNRHILEEMERVVSIKYIMPKGLVSSQQAQYP